MFDYASACTCITAIQQFTIKAKKKKQKQNRFKEIEILF